ncbi:hypothetical protein [Nonomuraea sp. NPDC049141]|uniref:hypothetical protein n=1 Tax=unclassified Nonomuraea TaxID=2593643 RepID=UPI00340C14B5
MESEKEKQRPDLPELMAQLERSMAGILGIDQFIGAGAAFVKGEEVDIDAAVDGMMSFFTGEIGGSSVERQRLLQLAQTMRRQAGGVPIFMLTFTTCSEVFTCSYACC